MLDVVTRAGIKSVEANNLVIARKQGFTEEGANETGAARDQNSLMQVHLRLAFSQSGAHLAPIQHLRGFARVAPVVPQRCSSRVRDGARRRLYLATKPNTMSELSVFINKNHAFSFNTDSIL